MQRNYLHVSSNEQFSCGFLSSTQSYFLTRILCAVLRVYVAHGSVSLTRYLIFTFMYINLRVTPSKQRENSTVQILFSPSKKSTSLQIGFLLYCELSRPYGTLVGIGFQLSVKF